MPSERPPITPWPSIVIIPIGILITANIYLIKPYLILAFLLARLTRDTFVAGLYADLICALIALAAMSASIFAGFRVLQWIGIRADDWNRPNRR